MEKQASNVPMKIPLRDLFESLEHFVKPERSHSRSDHHSRDQVHPVALDVATHENYLDQSGYLSSPNYHNSQISLTLPISPQPPRNNRNGQPRNYTDLGMSLSDAFHKLVIQGKLKPIGPTPKPTHPQPGYLPAHYCAYHRGHGHSTNRCIRLRHDIQDLIEKGVITISHLNNPLPNHHVVPSFDHINLLSMSESTVDPTQFIIPTSQPKPTIYIGEKTSIMLLNANGEDPLPELFDDEDERLFFDEGLEDLFYLEELDLGLEGIQWWDESMVSDNSAWLECEDWIEHLDHASMNLLFDGSKSVGGSEDAEMGTS